MNFRKVFLITACLFVSASSVYAAHHGQAVGSTLNQKENVDLAKVPAQVLSVIKKARPDFKAMEAEKELKHGNTYFDIEGLDGNGNEIEFDMLLGKDGTWTIAEIQRDLNMSQLPEPVAKLFQSKVPNTEPARIIESDQGDGVVVYEFYTRTKGKEKKYEIKLAVELLEKEWQH